MTLNLQIDEYELRKALAVLKPDGELFEVRAIAGSGRLNFSGYFRDADILIERLRHLNPTEPVNIYFTLNDVNEACYAREQRERFVKNAKTTTSDNDIDGYGWLLLDFDPERVSGTSSTETELQQARAKARQVFGYLRSIGWHDPVVGMSGNGYHLLYRIRIAKNRADTVKTALRVLNLLFGDSRVKVDTAVFNPARICKLYGTMSVKGSDTPERPHRMAKLLHVPEKIEANPIGLLEALEDWLPKEPERPQKYNGYNPQKFDLEHWLQKHNIPVKEQTAFADGGRKYILEECVFDPSHKGKDACILRLPSGALVYKCLHNSCADKDWHAFREKFEPDAYTGYPEYHKPNHEAHRAKERCADFGAESEILQNNEPVFFTTNDILQKETPPEEFMKTGIKEIDKKLRGLKKGFVTCLSGLRGCGKSSILSQLCNETMDQGYRVALYSGELAPKNLLKWLLLQCAGKEYVRGTAYENYFVLKDGCEQPLCDWMNGKIYVYNNDHGDNFSEILGSMQQCVNDHDIDLILLDNLMTIDITELDPRDRLHAQSEFVGQLKRFAVKNNVHVLFVAHPRKSQGFLRLDDISGSNDIVNRVDNALILHRVNADFKRLSKETLKWRDNNPNYACTNTIEICKDRDGGVQDVFVPLWFEKETKRLKNSEFEKREYGWRSEALLQEDLPF